MHKHHSNYSCTWLLAEGTCWEEGRWEWGMREQYGKICSILNVCVPSKCMCWNPVPSVLIFGGGTFGRWLGHEGGALVNEISALIKETPELPHHFCPVGHSERTAVCAPGSRLSPDTRSAGALILDFSASKMVSNVCWLSYPAYDIYIFCSSPNRLRQSLSLGVLPHWFP